MLPYFTEQFGNPAQPAARLRLGSAATPSTRRATQVAALINAQPARSSSPAAPANRTTSRSKATAAAPARSRQPHRHRRHRAQVGARLVRAASSRDRLSRSRVLGVDARRLHRSRRAARARCSRRHDPRLGHGRQQRDRHAAAARRDRRDRRTSTARCSTPTRRRRPGKVPLDVSAMQHRSAVADRRTSSTARRAPARCSCAAAKPKLALTCADRRRRPGERPALRHAERPRHRRPRPRGGDLPARDGRRSARGSAALRDRLLDGLRARARRRARERLARAPAAAQPARQLRRRRRRGAADGARRSRGVDRFGLQLRQPGAVARAAGDRRRSAIAPARRSASASAARPPTPTSTSPSIASTTVVRALRTRIRQSAAVVTDQRLSTSDDHAHTKITVAHSPDSDDAFMFFGLASGNVDTGGIVVDQVLVGHRDAESRGVRRQVRSHRRLVSRLRAPRRQVRAAAARRQHGRQATARSSSRRQRRRRRRSVKGTHASRFPGTLTTAYLTLRLYEPRLRVRRRAVRSRFSRRCSTARPTPGCSSTKAS